MTTFSKPPKLELLWANLGDKTPAPDDNKINLGFIVEIPTIEQFNYLENKQDAMLAHLNQRGIAEWDITTGYLAGLSYAQGSNGIIYKSKTNHSGVNPVTEVGEVNWEVAFKSNSDVYSKSESNALYLAKSSNLSDLANFGTARTNLGVYSTSQCDVSFAARTSNLSDLTSASTAFNNIKQAASESYVGAVQLASSAETNAGSDNTKAITPAKLKLGFSISLGSSGYISFPTWLGGWVFNWAKANVPNNTTYTINWIAPFPTYCYASWCNYSGDDGGSSATLWQAGAPSAYGATVRHGTGSPKNVTIFGIGN